MLRKDGDYTIFLVAYWEEPGQYPEGRWVRAGGCDHFQANIPQDIRFVAPAHNGKHHEPFQTFTASGRCWQETGVHGSYTFEPAKALADVLTKYNPTRRFRVEKVVISQHGGLVYTPPVLVHNTHGGLVFTATRRNLAEGVVIHADNRLRSRENYAAATAEFIGWYATTVLPTLDRSEGFQGFDCITFTTSIDAAPDPEDELADPEPELTADEVARATAEMTR